MVPSRGCDGRGMWDELRDGAEVANSTRIYELGKQVTSGGGASLEEAAALAVFLASDDAGTLNGRLVSATTDDYVNAAPRLPELSASDVWTLRRVELP